MCHSKELHFKFENVRVIHVFMREYSIDILRKNDFDPGLLDTVPQQRYWW